MKSAQERNSSKPRLSKVVQAGGCQGGIGALFAGDLRNSVVSGGYHAQEGISAKTLVSLDVKLLSRLRITKGSGAGPNRVCSVVYMSCHWHGSSPGNGLEPLRRANAQASRTPVAVR